MSDLNQTSGVGALKQKNYSVFSIVCLIYCSVAAGAFGVEEMISGCGPGMTVIVLVGIALFWGIPDCFRMAELSSLMPEEGGLYYYAKKMFGEFWSFQVGWWAAASYYLCSATYVVLAVDYLSTIFSFSDTTAIIIKLAIILFFTVINLMGLEEVSIMSIIFSVIIFIAFATVTVVGFAHWNYNPLEPMFVPEEGPLSSLASGIGIGIWMYCGWGIVTYIAGEISNKKVLSKSLVIAVPLIALSYILPAIAALAAIGQWDSWTTVGSEGVGFSTVLQEYLGPAATIGFVIIAIVGQLAIFNTNIAGGSRTFFVMSDDRLFPRKFMTNVSKKRGVPYVGILSMALVTVIMMQMDFQALVLVQVIPIFACGVFTSLAFVKARRIVPVEEREKRGLFTVSGGKLGSGIVVICPLVIAIVAFFLNGTDYFLFGLIFLLSGIILYIIIKPVCGGISVEDSKHYPVNPKTKLAFGDIYRIAKFMLIIGATSVAGSFLLRVIEGSWGPEYYAYEYGGGLLGDFYGMMTALLIGGIICLVIALACYLWARKIDEKMEMPVCEEGEVFIDE